LLVVLAVCVALLGTGLGLLASAFARTEFQVVQFFPLLILPRAGSISSTIWRITSSTLSRLRSLRLAFAAAGVVAFK
jgi:ABC-type multidrug transport system permease subunit